MIADPPDHNTKMNFSEHNASSSHRGGDATVQNLRDDRDQQKLAIMLSITTRGIGFGICHLIHMSSYYDTIRIPNIYAMYRVFLGLLECKLEAIKTDPPVVPRLTEHTQTLGVTNHMLDVAKLVPIVPEPIRKIVNAIGWVEREEKIYVPAIAANSSPRPENIILSNLRAAVVFLADPNAPVDVRRRFHNNCPFPGAIWRDDVVQNPNEIIPENYDKHNDFGQESLMIAPYLASLRTHLPQLLGGRLDFEELSGSASLLLSNEMEDLKTVDRKPGEDLNDYYRRCGVPEGNIRSYSALCRLTPAERIEGQVNLLG